MVVAEPERPKFPFHAGNCCPILGRDLCEVGARAYTLFLAVSSASIWSFSTPSWHCGHLLVFVPL